MPTEPYAAVTVLEVGPCYDPNCFEPSIRFIDPHDCTETWLHADAFEKIG